MNEQPGETTASPDRAEEQTPDEERGLLLRMCSALLFATDRPLSVNDLATELDVEPELAEELLDELSDAVDPLGLIVERVAGGYRYSTAPDLAGFLERALGEVREVELSDAAMEVLAIIAYHQPITRPAVDDFRQVNSSGVVGTLMEKGLIATRGREESPGRPFLYVTTGKFLELFGLDSLEDLPQVEWVEDEVPEEEELFPPEMQTGEQGEVGEGDERPERASGPEGDSETDQSAGAPSADLDTEASAG